MCDMLMPFVASRGDRVVATDPPTRVLYRPRAIPRATWPKVVVNIHAAEKGGARSQK